METKPPMMPESENPSERNISNGEREDLEKTVVGEPASTARRTATRVDSEMPTLIGPETTPSSARTPTRNRSLPPGRRYEVVREIGKGGMGVVYLARDDRLKRWVALKRLGAEFINNTHARIRFENEARAIASLSHFHIVHAYEVDEDGQGPYIAMEYVSGPERPGGSPWGPQMPMPPLTLEKIIKEQGPASVEDAIAMGQKLCTALAYAHGRGLIHRDIKPANILIDEHQEPKIVDFGLARATDSESEGLTMAGAQMLTIGYGAPEQETDASTADHRADLYALGATLWYMLTAQSPRFFRESEVPDRLSSVLVRALQKDREQRFSDAEEFLEALKTSTTATTVLPDISTGVPPGYWRCVDCSTINKDELEYCGKCGEAASISCPSCAEPVLRSDTHCGSCGIHLPLYLANLEKLRIERISRSHGHLCASRNIAQQVASVKSAVSKQQGMARARLDLIQDQLGQRKQLSQDFISHLSAGRLLEAATLLEKLKPLTPDDRETAEWDLAEEDVVFRQEMQHLRDQLESQLKVQAEQAQAAKDISRWSENALAIRLACPQATWVTAELSSGDSVLQDYQERLREIKTRLAQGKIRTPEAWEEMHEQAEQMLVWNNFPEDKSLRIVQRDLAQSVADIHTLFPRWQSGQANPAEIARLNMLLPDHPEIAAGQKALGSDLDQKYLEASELLKSHKISEPETYRKVQQNLENLVAWGASQHHWKADTELMQVRRRLESLETLWPLWQKELVNPAQLAQLARVLPGNQDIQRRAGTEEKQLKSAAESAELAGQWEEAQQLWVEVEHFHPDHKNEFVEACGRRRIRGDKKTIHWMKARSGKTWDRWALVASLALFGGCFSGWPAHADQMEWVVWMLVGGALGASLYTNWRLPFGRMTALLPVGGLICGGAVASFVGLPGSSNFILPPSAAAGLFSILGMLMMLIQFAVWVLSGDVRRPAVARRAGGSSGTGRNAGLLFLAASGSAFAWWLGALFTTCAAPGFTRILQAAGATGAWPSFAGLLLAALFAGHLIAMVSRMGAVSFAGGRRFWGGTCLRCMRGVPLLIASAIWVFSAGRLILSPENAARLSGVADAWYVAGAALTGFFLLFSRIPLDARLGLVQRCRGLCVLKNSLQNPRVWARSVGAALLFGALAAGALIAMRTAIALPGLPATLAEMPASLWRWGSVLLSGGISFALLGGAQTPRKTAMAFPAVAFVFWWAMQQRVWTDGNALPEFVLAAVATAIAFPLVFRARAAR